MGDLAAILYNAPLSETHQSTAYILIINITMKAIICVVLFAAAALAAPEGKREKRGYLHGGFSSLSLDHSLALSHSALDLHDIHSIGYGPVLSAPIISAPSARLVSYNKVVSVPKVVRVQKLVSVPKVVSFPGVVKVSKIVESPYYSHGWW